MEAPEKNIKGKLMQVRNILNLQWDALQAIQSERPEGGREVAIAITNIQQARMWLGEALRVRGDVEPTKGSSTENSHT